MSNNADDSDNDSDEWATQEIDFTAGKKSNTDNKLSSHAAVADTAGDDGWATKIEPTTHSVAKDPAKGNDKSSPGEPMILVDMTVLSNDEIHSKFDANAVNDPVAVKKLRQRIEQEYDAYAKNSDLLAAGTVVPCGSSVWKSAIATLRVDRRGHYFCAVFPPKK